jgi:hypothetical protein
VERLILIAVLFFGLQSSLWAETIHYDIYTGFKVGEASLKIAGETQFRGQKTILIIFKATGPNLYDEENIFLDPQTYKPLFVQRIYNKEKIFEDYFTDRSKIRIVKKVGDKTTVQVLSNKKQVENIYGFIYRYRKTGSFKTGDLLELNLPTRDLKIELVKRVPLAVAGKKYDTFYMQSKPSKYKIWFESSELKVPLRISSIIGVLNTSMIMTRYEK